MAISAESNRLNLKTAARNAANSLGVDAAKLTFDQRTAFNKALAAEVLKYPLSFTAETLNTARIIYAREYRPLESEGFDLGDIADAIGNEAAAINNALNPFSEKNRRLVFAAVVIVAALYVLAPRLAAAVQK